MSAPDERKTPKFPVLGALGAGLALVACCLVAPVLLGALMMALGLAIEAALVAAALVLGAIALRRHRANRADGACLCGCRREAQ